LKILLLTQWFQPEPMFKGLPFAKALKDKGHEVEVLTGFPNYPEGRLYSSYRLHLYQKEIMDGITVHRTFLYPSHNQSGFLRIVNYFSFGISSFLIVPFIHKKYDIIYVYNLVTLGPTAFLLRLFSGAKVLYDVQDLWPESVHNSGLLSSELLNKLLQYWCNWVYKRADHIVVLSPGFMENIIIRGINEKNITVIYNWNDSTQNSENLIGKNIVEQFNIPNKFNIVFAGTMGIYQGMDTILDAAQILGHEYENIQFVLIGGGTEVERLKERALQMNLNNVKFLGRIPKDIINSVLKLADVFLVHLIRHPMFSITIPSKTQAYMSSGKPILMGVEGNAADLIQEANCGLIFEPENVKSLIDAISRLYILEKSLFLEMGERGLRFYQKHLCFEKGVERFIKLFQNYFNS